MTCEARRLWRAMASAGVRFQEWRSRRSMGSSIENREQRTKDGQRTSGGGFDMSFETIEYNVDDGIARLALNRPERLNAINRQMTADLRAAVATANDDSGVRVIILSGAGRPVGA